MLQRILRARPAPAKPATLPAGTRVYAIGDVHGCADLLDRLLERIDTDDAARDRAETGIIFLGDLVDRGPRSAEVVERLRCLADERPSVRFLLGNHEEVFLGALAGDEKATRLFCRIGGRETALSYGMSAAEYERLDYPELVQRLSEIVPGSHRRFLSGFEDLVILGDYAFVHAGVRPGVALEQQRTSDLRWMREPFLDHAAQLEKVVVHGHTIRPEVEYRSNRIGIDTGGYATGRLTALGLEGAGRWTLHTEGHAECERTWCP